MNNNQNTNAALCYLFGWVTGLIFLLVEKDNKFVRFNAAQSLLTFGVLGVLMMVLFFLAPIFMIASVVLWAYLMYQAYQGKMVKLPVIGDFAEKVAGTVGTT